jgi:hypothetical protein
MLALPPIVLGIITPLAAHLTTILILAAAVVFFLVVLLVLYSDAFLLRKYRAEKTDNQQLQNIIETLSRQAGISPPALYLSSAIKAPNAFVIGRKPKIILTRQALETLFLEEITALLAREIAEIKYTNMFLKTTVAVLCGLLTGIPSLVMWTALLTGFGQEDDPAPKLFKLLATAATAPVAAIPIQVLRLTQRKKGIDQLARAIFEAEIQQQTLEHVDYNEILQRIQHKLQTHPSLQVNPSHAPLFAINPLPAGGKMNLYNPLFDGDTVQWRHVFFFSALSYTGIFFIITVITTFAEKDFMPEVVALRAQAFFPLILFALLFCYSLFRKNQQTTMA